MLSAIRSYRIAGDSWDDGDIAWVHAQLSFASYGVRTADKNK